MNSTKSQRFVRSGLIGQLVTMLVLFNLLWPAQAQPTEPKANQRLIVTPLDQFSGTSDITTIPGQNSNRNKQEKFLEQLDKRLNNPGKAKGLTKKLYQFIPSVVMVPDDETFQALTEMKENREIDFEPDIPHPPTLGASIPLIGTNAVWNQGYTGNGQAVAILDTGVDKTHPALTGKVISEACYSTNASTYSASTVCPDGREESTNAGSGVNCDLSVKGCDHGTHVAGIVAANGSVTGVAKEAQLIAMQVFSEFNDTTYCGTDSPCALSFTSAQIAALERVLELHQAGTQIAAVNMSLGGGNYASACSSSMQGIVDQLRAVGIAVIAASGNSGYTDGIASPACVSSVISVGNTTKEDSVASSSNSAEILDLLAPGSLILSTIPGGGTAMKTGTSMATPHVAGAFAVLKSAVSSASVDDILNALKQTGEMITDSRNAITKPRINLDAALKFLNPSQTDPANIEVDPLALDFGDRKEGTTSPPKTVTVSNSGGSGLNIAQMTLSDTSNFSISTNNCANQTISPGSQCTIGLTFNPTSPGIKTATLSIPSNDTDTPTVAVTLTGNGIAVQSIDANPTAYDFGNVELGQSSGSTRFTISNNGGSDLTINAVTRAGDFVIMANNCSGTIPPNGSCQIEVKFEPQSTGTRTGTISIDSDDPNTPILQISLTGNGIDNTQPLPPAVQVKPSVHNFGEVAVGQSASKTFEVSNAGDGELFVGMADVDNAAFQVENGCEGRSLPKGTKCPIKVEFMPESEGPFVGIMSVENSSSDNPEAPVPMAGQGVAPQDSLPVDPPPVAKASCQLYGVHDQGLNNSQFFTISKTDQQITPLGSTYEGYDVEALAIHPITDEIYAASGNDTAEGKPKGHLYRVDGQTGELIEVGSTGFDEIGDLAFDANATLWAWAKKVGLITIDVNTGQGTVSISNDMPVEGLTVSKNGAAIFYAAVNRDLLKYDGAALETICDDLLEGKTEALEMLPSGNLLIGIHNNKDYNLKVIDPNNNCNQVKEAEVPSGKYNDVEGVGWPINACNPT